MEHAPFNSLETMLSVEAMSAIEARAVTSLNVRTWIPELSRGASECQFLKVESVGSGGSRHYVVKRTAFETDIVRRLSVTSNVANACCGSTVYSIHCPLRSAVP